MGKKQKVQNKEITNKPAPKWFYFVMIIIPIAFTLLTEIFLRVINYGLDFTTFSHASNYYPDKLFLNPDLPYKYFSNLKNPPTVLPDGFDDIKKENAFRVFVIGGSTTAGWPYVPNASFSRNLKRRLELVFPKNTIEVINCGVSAINSYTLIDIVSGILEQQPDLILIYAGHNEYYGALGAGSSVSIGNSRLLINTYLWLKDLRTTQLLEDFIAWVYGAIGSDELDNKFEKNETLMARMIGESLITLNSDTYWNGISQFEGNLRDILEMINKENVPVLIGKLTSNTLDMKPFVSVKTTDPPPADSIYNLGRRAYEEGRFAEADSLLSYAKELDALRFRAPQKMNEVIDNLRKEFGFAVADMDSLFRKNSPNGIVGYNLIVDHLHPNIEGYKLMAKAFFLKMARFNFLPDGERFNLTVTSQDNILNARFPFTRLDSTLAEMQLIQLTGTYPFVPRGTPNYKKLNYKITDIVDSLCLQIINKDIEWETAHVNLADRYFEQGNFDGFIKEIDAVIQERPYFDQPYEYLTRRLVENGMAEKAFPYLKKLHSFKPSYFTNKWLGQIYLHKNQYAAALNYLKEAVKDEQVDYQTWYNIAGAYYYKGETDKAIIAINNSLNLKPGNQLAKDFHKQLMSLQK
jgi:tetratricopeptide (TPR) repeat protein